MPGNKAKEAMGGSTPSPIGWEESYDKEILSGATPKDIKSFIRQTLSQERERAVLKGERLRIIEEIRAEEKEKVIKILSDLETDNPDWTVERRTGFNTAIPLAITRIQNEK